MIDTKKRTILDLHESLINKDFSALELTEAYLATIAAKEKELNAFKIKPSTPPSSPSEGVPASMNYPPLEPSSR